MTRKRLDISFEDISIEAVAAEGKAIAHSPDGQVIFVPFAVPGDVVDIRIQKKKKNYLEGVITAIKKPSADRLEPFCKHFGVCGGCRWQPLPYALQLEAKRQQVYDQLVRIGHLDVPEILPTLPSGKTVFYRNKLEFTASERRWILPDEDPESLSDSQRCGLGFHVGKFFDKVLDLEQCWLQPEPSNAIRLFVKAYMLEHGIPFYNIRENRGVFRTIFVRTSESGSTMVIACFAEDFPLREAFLDALSEKFPQISSLYYIINSKLNDSISDQICVLYKGDDAIYETMEGLRFKIGPKSFYQTNTLQAYNLYKVARDFAELSGNEVVYDLYTGTGTIANFVAKRARQVIGIEYVPEAIEDAKHIHKAVVVHVVTQKGRGYEPAVKHPARFHGTAPFHIDTGLPKNPTSDGYTDIFSSVMVKLAGQDEKLVAITAAMLDGVGLKRFRNIYPDRFFDVGIAEEHAVTFAAGLAAGGMHPVVAIYSTFLQRAYDEIVHDVCLQDLPVVFAIDRAGIVGAGYF